MIVSGSSRPISKTKKRIMSLPNTPNDVYKNKENEATKPILLSAESKVNQTLHSNHGKRNTAKKVLVRKDLLYFLVLNFVHICRIPVILIQKKLIFHFFKPIISIGYKIKFKREYTSRAASCKSAKEY